MSTPLPTVEQIANWQCGDILKVWFLNHYHKLGINPYLVRPPAGDIEKAFALLRAQQGADSKPKTPAELQESIMRDHYRGLPERWESDQNAAVREGRTEQLNRDRKTGGAPKKRQSEDNQITPPLEIQTLTQPAPEPPLEGDAVHAQPLPSDKTKEAPAVTQNVYVKPVKLEPVTDRKVEIVDGKPQWTKPESSVAAILAGEAPAEEPAAAPTEEIAAAPMGKTSDLDRGEFEVEGEIYVTAEKAAQIRGGSVGGVHVAASQKGWRRVPHPEGGRGKVYLKSQVQESVRRPAAG